ncbi:hypothetical protein [Aeromonas hydrophila]|uniref:hypothetical protein n=1 Tax=Aeromonas hydrophila TaxID=644 RepID=UPI0038D066E6
MAHTDHVFAALRWDGQAVTCGLPIMGCDSHEVAPCLVNARSVLGNAGTVAALNDDCAVVYSLGGEQANQLSSLLQGGGNALYATYNAFAALTEDPRE